MDYFYEPEDRQNLEKNLQNYFCLEKKKSHCSSNIRIPNELLSNKSCTSSLDYNSTEFDPLKDIGQYNKNYLLNQWKNNNSNNIDLDSVKALSKRRENNNNTSLNSSINIGSFSRNQNSESFESLKKEKSFRVKSILNELKRKPKIIGPKSPNTNIKQFGELFPGPGDYNPKYDIGYKHNLRYKKLFDSHPEPNNNLKFIIEKKRNLEERLGPGTYNINENQNYKSYSQNRKVFISLLNRPSIINEKENDPMIGPGSYEIVSSFDKSNIQRKEPFFIRRNNKENIISNNLNFIENNILSYKRYKTENQKEYERTPLGIKKYGKPKLFPFRRLAAKNNNITSVDIDCNLPKIMESEHLNKNGELVNETMENKNINKKNFSKQNVLEYLSKNRRLLQKCMNQEKEENQNHNRVVDIRGFNPDINNFDEKEDYHNIIFK